jgi:hypothetical protein
MRKPSELPLHKPSGRAFTRVELCAALAALVLLMAVVWPALASSKADGERVVCFNNLRLVGRGVNEFAAEHGGFVSWRTLRSQGGTKPDSGPKPGIAWYEYAVHSNYFGTPRILACPSDSGVRVVKDFGAYMNPVDGQGKATSYGLQLDVFPTNATSIVAVDRNPRFDPSFTGCSSGANNAQQINARSPATLAAWTNAVHGTSGHVLRLDGAVLYTDTLGLKAALQVGDDNGTLHFLGAR